PSEFSTAIATVMNWSAYGEHEYEGRVFGQKDREFEPYFDFPRRVETSMELAVGAPPVIRERLLSGGWHIRDPRRVAGSPADYEAYLRGSRGEFSVAKHGYVTTRSGWFSDRSS